MSISAAISMVMDVTHGSELHWLNNSEHNANQLHVVCIHVQCVCVCKERDDLLYPFRLVKISLHVLSFLVASSDSLLRDATRWLPADIHSSVYDNPFDPSCRRSTPSHPSLSLPFIATEPFNVHLMHEIYLKESMKANFKGSSKHSFKS